MFTIWWSGKLSSPAQKLAAAAQKQGAQEKCPRWQAQTAAGGLGNHVGNSFRSLWAKVSSMSGDIDHPFMGLFVEVCFTRFQSAGSLLTKGIHPDRDTNNAKHINMGANRKHVFFFTMLNFCVQ